MLPGPANIGIAKGVNDISSFSNASSVIFLLIPLCLCVLLVRNANPDRNITIPPDNFIELSDMPKKWRTWLPVKKATTNITATYKEHLIAILVRASALSVVNVINNGIAAMGLITDRIDTIKLNRTIMITKFHNGCYTSCTYMLQKG